MGDTLFALPFQYWLACLLLVVGFAMSVANLKNGIGLPMAAVLATVSVWYMFDVFYNDYAGSYTQMFSAEVLGDAWWQVITFLFVFILLAPFLHSRMNRRYLANRSQIFIKFKTGVDDPEFQRHLSTMSRLVLSVWVILMMVAMLRYKGDYLYFLFPYLGDHPGPWLNSGVGGGVESLYALATNLHMLVAAVFGVIAALSNNKTVRRLALLGVFLSWPLYLFDRTRGYILLIVIPGSIAWVFLRIRGSLLKKLAVLAIVYMFINAWFGFIIASRLDGSIMDAFLNDKFKFSQASEEHHQGLNMFEELSWIVMMTDNGTFNPNPGENYLANLANLVPRDIWPGKPTIGLDYATARGLGGAAGVGVYATLSEGVVGQGVANFGLYLGPVSAALLMSLWASLLARVDLMGNRLGYIPLYGLALIITFNMGRDITAMNLYPFFFGFIICWWINRKEKRKRVRRIVRINTID